MTPLNIAYVVVAAICSVVGLIQLFVAFRVRQRTVHLLFALAAVSVAMNAVAEYRLVSSTTPQEYLGLLNWGALFIVTTMVSMSWYVDLRTGASRRWMVVAETAIGAVTVVLDFTVGLTYEQIQGLREVDLGWLGTIHLGQGSPSYLAPVGAAALVGFAIILLDTTIRLVRKGEHRTAWVIGSSLGFYSVSLLLIFPIDQGLIDLPFTHNFAFLLMVAAMGWDLTEGAVKASRLSLEILANERRWRQLVENIRLLVARVDHDGRVVAVNPHFERVLGYERDEAVGRHFWEVLAPEFREERKEAFHRAMQGEPTLEVEVQALTATGEKRDIAWRNAILFNADGAAEGMLSIGNDITARLGLEASRDRALQELEELKNQLEEENIYLREEIRSGHDFVDIVGDSHALHYVLDKVRQVADSDTSVLIMGETGVGKELIARTIHAEGPRADQPFVVVNCAALPVNLIESELFGHEKGAFTGADRRRIGRFELADGGTLLLDEIGELPLEMQPKLLRVLEEGEVERVGGTQTTRFDVRVISATNRNIRAEMDAGRFREDLYYRIAVMQLTVPPLRERLDDIPVLVQHFARLLTEKRGITIDQVPVEVMRRLQAYAWPGNVRELRNVLERAVLVSGGGVLRLAEPLRNSQPASGQPEEERPSSRVGMTLAQVERQHIVETLEACGKISGPGGASEALGLADSTLRYRMKKLGIAMGRRTRSETA